MLLNYYQLKCSGKLLALKLRDHLTSASSAQLTTSCVILGKSAHLSGPHL